MCVHACVCVSKGEILIHSSNKAYIPTGVHCNEQGQPFHWNVIMGYDRGHTCVGHEYRLHALLDNDWEYTYSQYNWASGSEPT